MAVSWNHFAFHCCLLVSGSRGQQGMYVASRGALGVVSIWQWSLQDDIDVHNLERRVVLDALLDGFSWR